jgi:SAM-dependent methyltransferase
MTCLVDLQKYRNGDTDEFSDRGPPDKILHFMDHASHLEKYHDILDVGCGVGRLVTWLKERGHTAYGLTYQPAEVAAARERGEMDVHEGDMHNMLRFNPRAFDAIVCWDVLEHSVAPLIALSEMKRVLRDDGVLLVFIPDQRWVECRYHVIVPTVRQMMWLFRLVGFHTVHVTRYRDEMAVYRAYPKEPT